MPAHHVFFDFRNNTHVWNPEAMILDRLSDLAENQVKSFQGIPELLLSYHVPMGDAEFFGNMIKFLE